MHGLEHFLVVREEEVEVVEVLELEHLDDLRSSRLAQFGDGWHELRFWGHFALHQNGFELQQVQFYLLY